MSSRLQDSLKCWLDTALAFFYPNVCQICGLERAVATEGFVGVRCWSRPGGVQFIEPPFCRRCGLPYAGEISAEFVCSNCREMELHFQSARAAVLASRLVLEVVHRYKYRRALWFEPFLAQLLLRKACPALSAGEWDMIVPVPLHTVKYREREFNQAERLARHLAEATGIPVNIRILKRVQPTQTQTMLTRQERSTNVRNAFRLRPGCGLNGERIVLVDDILTTGATTSACARALMSSGAGAVSVWTVARGA